MDVTQWKVTLEGRDDEGRVLSSFMFDDGGSIGDLLGTALLASLVMDRGDMPFDHIAKFIESVYFGVDNCYKTRMLYDVCQHGKTSESLARAMVECGQELLGEFYPTPTPAPPAPQE